MYLVLFCFHTTGDELRHTIEEAIEEYMNETCVVFRRRTSSDIDYIKFVTGSG